MPDATSTAAFDMLSNPPMPQQRDPRMLGQLERNQQQGEALARREQAEMAPFISKAQETLGQPIPKPPTVEGGQLQRVPKMRDLSAEQSAAANEFVKTAFMFAGIIGGFGRRGVTTSLNAFGSMVKGFREGQADQAKLAATQWKAAADEAIENNRTVMEEYQNVLKDRSLDIDQQMQQIQLIATKYKDPLMMQAAEAKNLTLVAKILDQQFNADRNFSLNVTKVNAQLQKLKMQAGGLWDDDTVDFAAEQVIAGDKSALQNVGRGAQGGENIARVRKRVQELAKERGISGEQLAIINQRFIGEQSYQRSAGTQAARIETASNEVAQLLPQAVETSRNLPRGRFVKWNELVQSWEQGTSDPEYNDFVLANFALINAYTRAMNPQGVPRIAERLEQKANGILSVATSPESYEVQANRLWKEVEASKRAVAQTRQGVTTLGPSPAAQRGGVVEGGPKAGDVVGGYQFMGGDPNDKRNWTQVQP